MGKFYIKNILIIRIFSVLLLVLLLEVPEKEEAPLAIHNGAVELKESVDKVSLDQFLFILKDPEDSYSIEEVTAPPLHWNFMPNAEGIIARGDAETSYWVQFNVIDNAEETEWLLELPVSSLEQAVLYSPDSDGGFAAQGAGREIPETDSGYHHHHPVFDLNFEGRDAATFYLYFKSDSPLQLPLTLWSRDAFEVHSQSITALAGLLYGIALVLSVYYLSQFIRHRQRVYLYFLLFGASVFCSLMALAGMTLSHIWPDSSWFDGRLIYAGIGIISIFALLYTESFLDTRRHFPVSRNFIKAMVWANAAFIVLLPVFEEFLSLLLPVSLIASAVLMLTVSAASWSKGIKYARYFTAGSALFLIGSGISFVMLYGISYLSTEAKNVIYLTVGASVFLSAFSLSDKEASKINEKINREKKAVERQRLEMESLKHANERKDELLAITSHGMRTPLYGMIGIAETLQDSNLGRMSAAAGHQLGAIVSNGKKLAHMIDSILDFSKLKQNSLEIHVEPVNLHDLTENVLEICRPLLKNPEVRLYETVPHNLPEAIADPDRYQQILYNLVENAIDQTVSGEIVVSAKKAGRHIQVSVRDTGKGIEQNKIPSLFEAFQKDGDWGKGGEAGTGIGLNITKRLVELHGGWLKVESSPGAGSTFSFTLPIYMPDIGETIDETQIPLIEEFTAADIAETVTTRRKSTSQIRALVVEREEVNRQLLIYQLEREGYSVFGAGGGMEAIRLLEDLPIDLVILDWALEDMNGDELCRHIRKEHTLTELPILMLSDRPGLREKTDAFTAGANDYLLKPCDKEEFLLRVDTLANLRTLTQEITNMNYFLERNVKERTMALEITNMNLVTVNDEIQEIEKSRNEMLSTISHELGTPITLIHSYIQAVKESIIDEKNPRYLDMIHNKLVMLERLTEDLVELAKYKSGNMTLRFESVRLGDWLDRLIQGMESDVTQSGRIFEYIDAGKEPGQEDYVLSIDVSRVDQVFSNILWNAVKHTSSIDGKISISTEILSRGKEGDAFKAGDFDGEVIIKVSDTGNGIPEDILPHIFDRFFKRDVPNKQQGSGLGLAIAKEIILSHKGEIWAESEIGKGSTFYISLPFTL
ncbi:ATP-binding protein [Planococcus sp. CAU13]|uniref:ATP-binding protein n=1 Tax=Planococcus sp. CAU13 TaxID=1541197 RepID=UPI00052FE61D|nr:ATP-binding protein [Planococcus sp. CAU13]